MDERHRLVVVALVVVLVLDEAEADEVAHGRTCVPAHVVRVHVDLLEVPNHLVLVGDVGLRTGRRRREARWVGLVAVGARDINRREGKGICDLEDSIAVHPHKRPGGSSWEARGAVLHNLHHHLPSAVSLPTTRHGGVLDLEVRRGRTSDSTCADLYGTSF